jgi:hypothetical protein
MEVRTLPFLFSVAPHPRPVVRTKLDADQKPLQAKSITISVRCYETRLGVLGVMHSNVLVDYTQVLWSKPDGDHEYADIGELELPFRISIPAKVAGTSLSCLFSSLLTGQMTGFSTASYASVYKCSWRVEASPCFLALSSSNRLTHPQS